MPCLLRIAALASFKRFTNVFKHRAFRLEGNAAQSVRMNQHEPPAVPVPDGSEPQGSHGGAPLMPLDFQLRYPRRVRWSGWVEQPDGTQVHFSGFRDATPEDELWHRFHAPERGLSPDDLKAFRESKRGPMGTLFSAMLKLWS